MLIPLLAGMLLGALIAIITSWVTIAHICDSKTRKTFEIELETPREYYRGVIKVKEIIGKTKQNNIKLGAFKKK